MQYPSYGISKPFRLPDALWEKIRPLVPEPGPKKKAGRPRMSDHQAMSAIYYVLRTGIQWKALPRSLGAASTVHDRFQEWRRAGLFLRLWEEGLAFYDEEVGLDWSWQAMDGAMTKAPLGGKRYGSEPDRPGQARHQAVSLDGAARRSGLAHRRRRQPARHEAGRAYAGRRRLPARSAS